MKFVSFFGLENRQLLGELNGIDTLLQCLSVSANTSCFFNFQMNIYISNDS